MAETKDGRGPDGRWTPGHSGALKHGGEKALEAIRDGRPLTGVAAKAELTVKQELEDEGRYAIVVRNATRVQACADLYWDAVAAAAEKQDLEALDTYIRRYGWLAGVSLRAWAQVRDEAPDGIVYTVDYEQWLESQRQDAEHD